MGGFVYNDSTLCFKTVLEAIYQERFNRNTLLVIVAPIDIF